MHWNCSLLSKSFQHGGGLWFSHHTMHDRNVYSVCQLSCNASHKTYAGVSVSRGIFYYRRKFFVCQHGKIPAWRLCCNDNGRVTIPDHVRLVPGKKNKKSLH